MNPYWRQQKLKEYCAQKGIIITAYSPLGGQGLSGHNLVLTSDVLEEIANAKGKSVAQISLRWIYEQGANIVVKSFKKERLVENIEIFDWELTDEERLKINAIPQQKMCTVEVMLSEEGSLTSVDLADIEVIET